MKYAALVARREYLENIKTKGFWIGIMAFPIFIFLMIQVPIWLEEKAAPTRYFVLVDQAGGLENVIETGVERQQQRRILESLHGYAVKNMSAEMKATARQRALELPAGLADNEEQNDQAVDAFAKSGGMEAALKQLKPYLKPDAPPFVEPRRRAQRVPLPAGLKGDSDLATLARELKPYLSGQKKITVDGQEADLSAAILIPKDIEQQIVRPNAGSSLAHGGIEYWSVNVADNAAGLHDLVEHTVNTEIRRREFLARGLDAKVVREVEHTYAPLTSFNPKKEAGKETVNTADQIKQWAPSGFVYLLWISIFSISQMLLGNIIEEKSNRIIEVLLSSVTPGELMMGKLFGIMAVGLTIVTAWMLALFGILSWKAGGASDVAGQVLVVLRTSNLVPMFSCYFLLGYLLYAGVILSLGSVCNTLKEAQSYMGVISMLMMVPLLTMAYIPRDPNGPVARLLSWIPLYTPFAMMNRAEADPPLLDKVGTMLLLITSTATVLWMAGKIFRIGILRTGQPPKILEMLRWVKG